MGKNIILTCLDGHPKGPYLLRVAHNRAQQTNCELHVLHIETNKFYNNDKEYRAEVLKNLTAAQNKQATIHNIEAEDLKSGIRQFIDNCEHTIIEVFIGAPQKEGFLNEIFKSTSSKLTSIFKKNDILVNKLPLSSNQYTGSWFDKLQTSGLKFSSIFWALFYVFVAYMCSRGLRELLPPKYWEVNIFNITSFFILAIMFSSLRHGIISGLLSALAGFCVINYFYMRPLHSFKIQQITDGVGLTIFLLCAVLVVLTASYSRANNRSLIRKERRTRILYDIHNMISGSNSEDEALELVYKDLKTALEMKIAFFIIKEESPIQIIPKVPIELNQKEKQLLNDCWQQSITTGLGTHKRLNSQWRFEPIQSSDELFGIMAVEIPKKVKINASFGRLLSAISDQIANIILRMRLNNDLSQTKINEEKEKLRSTLLSSVSHDLKTPLASIIGGLRLHQRLKAKEKLTDETSQDLIHTALTEGQRLESFITNILDMTRLEGGYVKLKPHWYEASALLNNVIKRMQERLSNHKLNVTNNSKNIEVYVDKLLTEQVLQNVLDNAVKYSKPDSIIDIELSNNANNFVYSIKNEGQKIDKTKLHTIFDKYERLKQQDKQIAGTGLGLAICKAIMHAQKGNISANNHNSGVVINIEFSKFKA